MLIRLIYCLGRRYNIGTVYVISYEVHRTLQTEKVTKGMHIVLKISGTAIVGINRTCNRSESEATEKGMHLHANHQSK